MRVLAASVDVAARACSIIRTVYHSKELNIVQKGPHDPQSRADRESQRCVIQTLSRVFPGLHIIGEEGNLDEKNVSRSVELSSDVLIHRCPEIYDCVTLDELVVWVDPLDGTKEFTEGLLEHVTVLIGLAIRGIPVAGVIAQPFHMPNANDLSNQSSSPTSSPYITRVVWALVGLGVFGLTPKVISGPLPFPIDPTISKRELPHYIAVTRSHTTPTLASVLEAFGPTEVLRIGGCGYKVLTLLEGRAHVYVFPSSGTKKWDTCAPEAVLSTFGGRLTSLNGQPYSYHSTVEHANKSGLIATPVADWLPAYVATVPKDVLSALSVLG